MTAIRPPTMLSRVARRHISISCRPKGPRGPRSFLNKARTPFRITSRASKAQQHRQPHPQPQQHHQPHHQPQQAPEEASNNTLVATALAQNQSSDLVAPVTILHDPQGVLTPNHPAWDLLNNSSLVIHRQIEMMNVFLGFEQANKYVMMNGKGETIGYMAEQDHGMGSAIRRQVFRTHRSFTSHVFDKNEREILRIHRPFSWVSSRIRIYDPIFQRTSVQSAINQTSAAHISPLPLSEMRIIGEAQQQWAPLRRKYNLFNYRSLIPTNYNDSTPKIISSDNDSTTKITPPDNDSYPKITSPDTPNTETKALAISESQSEQAIQAGMQQFAHVNEPFLSWDFSLKDAQDRKIGSVNRNFVGFAREIFTDTGVYVLRMDSVALEETIEETAMTLDQRAVTLATAVSIDFDYFSRHSGHVDGGGFMPLWFPGMGGAAEGGAVGGSAEGGAGTIAGVEATTHGQQGHIDGPSPQAPVDPFQDGALGPPAQDAWGVQESQQQQQQQHDDWANDTDPWQGGNQGASGGEQGGGFDWGDWF